MLKAELYNRDHSKMKEWDKKGREPQLNLGEVTLSPHMTLFYLYLLNCFQSQSVLGLKEVILPGCSHWGNKSTWKLWTLSYFSTFAVPVHTRLIPKAHLYFGCVCVIFSKGQYIVNDHFTLVSQKWMDPYNDLRKRRCKGTPEKLGQILMECKWQNFLSHVQLMPSQMHRLPTPVCPLR